MMKLLKGVVSNVENTVGHYRAGIRNAGIRTVYTLRFEVRGWPVRYESVKPEQLNEGDEVILAGTAYRSSFVAVAYRNLTTGLEVHQSWVNWMIVGVLFSAVALFSPPYFVFVLGFENANSVVGMIFATFFFASLFGLIGFIGLHTALKILRAIKAIREAAP